VQIPCLTVYAFSLENWQRAREEVEFLLGLVDRVLRAELPALRDAGVRVRFIGELELLPEALRATIAEAEAETAANTGLNFTIALSYSGRQDICNAVQQLARQVAEGVLQPDDITPDLISAHLSTRRLPAAWQQPDLIIRSSGEQRLSNFLLWESAYAEMYFSSVLWPDFSAREFAAALTDYAGRQRRYGRRA
jgi:undecaprenyl diphosphate synthase